MSAWKRVASHPAVPDDKLYYDTTRQHVVSRCTPQHCTGWPQAQADDSDDDTTDDDLKEQDSKDPTLHLWMTKTWQLARSNAEQSLNRI